MKIMHQDGEYRLVIEKALKTDQGEYSCRAVNSMGEAVCSATVFVTEDIVQLVFVYYRNIFLISQFYGSFLA